MWQRNNKNALEFLKVRCHDGVIREIPAAWITGTPYSKGCKRRRVRARFADQTQPGVPNDVIPSTA